MHAYSEMVYPYRALHKHDKKDVDPLDCQNLSQPSAPNLVEDKSTTATAAASESTNTGYLNRSSQLILIVPLLMAGLCGFVWQARVGKTTT